MAIPLTDDEVLEIAREQIRKPRGFTSGFDVRDAYWRRLNRRDWAPHEYPRMRDVGPTYSWTAALRRLEKRGELRAVRLVGPRGAPAGVGFELPTTERGEA